MSDNKAQPDSVDTLPEKQTDKPTTESIEVIAKRLDTPEWQLHGLLLRKGWAYGHRVTEGQFKKELKQWLNGPTVPVQKGEK